MNNVTKKFSKKTVLDNITLNVEPGCSFLIGDNGSGKTTLVKIIAGLIKKFEGSVEYRETTSILLDLPFFYSLKSGKENLQYFLDKNEYEKSQELIKYFSMEEYINKKVKTYSNGMKKKLGLVIALSKNRDIYLLDEPTNSIDFETTKLLRNYLIELKKDKKILIVSHDLSIFNMSLVDSALMLKDHKLYEQRLLELDYKLYKVKALKEISGTSFKFEKEEDTYYFKIYNQDFNQFRSELGQFDVIEMAPLDYNDDRWIGELYYEKTIA